MGNTLDKEYEASLKSIETENYPDQWFYRPIGFRIAKTLRNTGITPNMITILSIFVGAAAGPLFYQHDHFLILLGIICLVIANILDCVDGQLARLTGIKSEIGRILDGIAGDIWFILIYVFLALKLKDEYGTWLFFIPAVLSGLSHLIQANITDYYKTLHLYFVSKEKGKEFQNLDEIRRQYRKMKNGPGKVLFFLYMGYTSLQEAVTPKLQQILKNFHSKYGDDIPEDIRLEFRQKSKCLMKRYIDLMTFNGRTIVLFIVVLTGPVWIYFLYEIIVLNIILAVSIHKHEKICTSFINR
jgi:phosphatidylglycerophosphate synthase